MNVAGPVSFLTPTGELRAAEGTLTLLADAGEPATLAVETGATLALGANQSVQLVSVEGGTLDASGAGSLKTKELALPSGTLELGRAGLIVDYDTTSPFDDVKAAILNDLIVSADNAGGLDIGYVDTATGPFSGSAAFDQPVDSTSVLAVLTLGGDVNLDLSVNASDLGVFAGNFNSATTVGWGEGDFSGDGLVNATDLGIFAGNFGQTLALAGSSAIAEELAAAEFILAADGWTDTDAQIYSTLVAAIPEPGSAALLAPSLLLLARRQKFSV